MQVSQLSKTVYRADRITLFLWNTAYRFEAQYFKNESLAYLKAGRIGIIVDTLWRCIVIKPCYHPHDGRGVILKSHLHTDWWRSLFLTLWVWQSPGDKYFSSVLPRCKQNGEGEIFIFRDRCSREEKDHIPSLVKDGLPQCTDLGHHDKVVQSGETPQGHWCRIQGRFSTRKILQTLPKWTRNTF